MRPERVEVGTNDVSPDAGPRMGKVVFSPPHFSFDYKNAALLNSSQGCAPLLACLYISKASYANKLILYPPLCLTLNSLSFTKS